jgi:class 3 adenylate cyclase/TolB-like protein/Tfp pilus assembly protein PilF
MPQESRHLAAILFSDMVGYSRISHRDEALAFRLIKEHREIVRPRLAQFEGREIKTMGDGFLAEFASVQAAVLCAIEIQKAHRERNQKVSPLEKFQIRIGIHMGDVTPTEGDVFGDGVNIAARIMQNCKPGRICMSGSVMDQARQVIPHWVSTIGPTRFKGIKGEIPLYAIYVEFRADQPPPRWKSGQTWLRRWNKEIMVAGALLSSTAFFTHILAKSSLKQHSPDEARRIAVLPLQNAGLSHDFDYLPNGITDEIISSLTQVKSIRVLARSSTAVLKDKTTKQIRDELDAAYVVEGSVQMVHDTLQIGVRLIDTATQENVWSKLMEGKVEKTFELEKSIADQLAIQFPDRGIASLTIVPSAEEVVPNAKAFQHYLKGKFLLEKRTRDGIFKGQEQLEKAIAHDPNYAPALAAMAQSYLLVNFYGFGDPRETNKKAEPFAKRALEIDPNNSDALLWQAERNAYELRNWNLADSLYRKAIALNPSSSAAYQWYGKFLTYLGRFADAKAAYAHAKEVDPLSQTTLAAVALNDLFQGNFEKTISAMDKAIHIDSSAILPHLRKGEALLMIGEYDRALSEFKFVNEMSPDSNYLYGFETMALVNLGKKGEAEAQLKKVLADSNTTYIQHYALARMYHALGRRDEAIHELELSAQCGESQIISIKVDPFFRGLAGVPSFQALLKTLKFSS